jgi:hypothetical protein
MATSTSSSSVVAVSGSQANRSKSAARVMRRRKVSYKSGRAIEMLGHAIEYLADEFTLDCLSYREDSDLNTHPQIEAIEILKKCNRTVFLSCPEIPTLADRIRALLRLQRVWR